MNEDEQSDEEYLKEFLEGWAFDHGKQFVSPGEFREAVKTLSDTLHKICR